MCHATWLLLSIACDQCFCAVCSCLTSKLNLLHNSHALLPLKPAHKHSDVERARDVMGCMCSNDIYIVVHSSYSINNIIIIMLCIF